MPEKKKQSKKKGLTGFTELHFLMGCCLIGAGCQICNGGYGVAIPRGFKPWSLKPTAQRRWEKHRGGLLAIWRDPEGRQPGVSGFCAEAYRGAGRTGLPCWAEIQFEGARLPKFDKKWPADVREAYKEIRDNVL